MNRESKAIIATAKTLRQRVLQNLLNKLCNSTPHLIYNIENYCLYSGRIYYMLCVNKFSSYDIENEFVVLIGK